jgi:flavin-dependent dehydrogenase
LCGDAAALIDPFTGEGIGNAMLSGMIAARHVQSAVIQNRYDEKFLSAYDADIYKALWKELRMSKTMQSAFKRSSSYSTMSCTELPPTNTCATPSPACLMTSQCGTTCCGQSSTSS